jgi:hypothetical protein
MLRLEWDAVTTALYAVREIAFQTDLTFYMDVATTFTDRRLSNHFRVTAGQISRSTPAKGQN